jgi:uncharacterized protein YndB with AHSA1/START domain
MKIVRLLLIVFASVNAYGEVASVTPAGFSMKYARTLSVAPAKAYAAFAQVQSWWNGEHTYSGKSANLSIDPKAGGCFCEKLSDGGIVHMTVAYAKRNEQLTLLGALGPLQSGGISGSMTVVFKPAGDKTELSIIYNVGGYYPGGLAELAPIVDQVIGEQVDRFARYVETGKPDRSR